MKKYILAARGNSSPFSDERMPVFALNGKWHLTEQGVPAWCCGPVHEAKTYDSIEAIEADEMTQQPLFWDYHTIFAIEEVNRDACDKEETL